MEARNIEKQNFKIGNLVKFGQYFQDINDDEEENEPIEPTPLEWTVLSCQNDELLLLLSKDGIDCERYDNVNEKVTYHNSSLCEWLNNNFIMQAFNEKERMQLVPIDGNNCISILNKDEFIKYYENISANLKPTEYARSKGSFVDYENGATKWWIRPNDDSCEVLLIDENGKICNQYLPTYLSASIRPIIKIKSNDEYISKKTETSIDINKIEEIFNIIANNYDDNVWVGEQEEKISKCIKKIIDKETIRKLKKIKIRLNYLIEIYSHYKENSIPAIYNNPYQFLNVVDSIDFSTCDNLALMINYDFYSYKRIISALKWILSNAYGKDGNVYIPLQTLIRKSIILLNFPLDFDFTYYLNDKDLLVKTMGGVKYAYLTWAYNIEKYLSKELLARKNRIRIITGGPGTGKTTKIKGIIEEYYNNRGAKICLCAPSGKAAKRMMEVTGYESKTIHRLLECKRIDNNFGNRAIYGRDRNNPLECDLLIIDEASMVDEAILKRLLEATPYEAYILLVGDVDQLPSISAGKVLEDMINSGEFTVEKLTKVYRQKEGSNIIDNSHIINRGEHIDLNIKHDDFQFYTKIENKDLIEEIKKVTLKYKERYNNEYVNRYQILCASKKGECGTKAINKILQKILNPRDPLKNEIRIKNLVLREGDIVIQNKNNYDIPYSKNENWNAVNKGVYNGEAGIIKTIDENKGTYIVDFGDKIARYTKKDLFELILAYAITVHKAQGSEYETVVIPMSAIPYPLLNRKLLYTAMTRAKKELIFVGEQQYFNTMVDTKEYRKRNSALFNKIYFENSI